MKYGIRCDYVMVAVFQAKDDCNDCLDMLIAKYTSGGVFRKFDYEYNIDTAPHCNTHARWSKLKKYLEHTNDRIPVLPIMKFIEWEVK